MYSHRNRSNDSRTSNKYTTHAALQLQKWHNSLTSKHCNSAASDQQLEDLDFKECVQLKRLIYDTFPLCKVNLIQLVNAAQMYGMYLLRKEEMRFTHGYDRYRSKELILYHVTTKSRAVESLKSGLDWRRTRRSKFGRGVSFSDDADYANYYADNTSKEAIRVIIVCAVLVNKTHRVTGKRNEGNLIVPPGYADTTVSPNGRVYVKYNDYDFYPLYLVHYQRTPEHLNESKYFRNNPHSNWQQNNRAMQQQQRERELQAQLERDQEQRQRELQEQRQREQAWRLEELRRQRYLQNELERRRKVQEQARRQQEQKQELRQQASRDQTLRRESDSKCLIL